MKIFLDNSNNSPDNNPPGFNKWVGGEEPHGSEGVKVLKTDTHCAYEIDDSTSSINTWYYDYGWCSDETINGPFSDQQVIKLGKVSK